ncbi:MAG: hypothetical protein UCH28_09695 [Adlercreutzia sp.]|nr:hypothetical protein [Adlercreutzia sp.]
MLGKLCAHEFKGLWKKAVLLLAIMVAAGVAGVGTVAAANVAVDTTYLSDFFSGPVASLFMLSFFLAFVVWASLVAMFVFIVMRFYRSLFTDEGYLTLTLPVSAGSIVAAKYLVGLVIMVVFSLVALGLVSAMTMAGTEGDPEMLTIMFSMMSGMFGIVHEFNAVSAAVGLVNVLIGAAYQLALAFVSFTLGAWWARRHKVAASVGLFFGIGWLVSLVFSMGTFATAFGGMQGMAFAASLSLVQMVCNAALAVGAVVLAAFVLKNKVDLS